MHVSGETTRRGVLGLGVAVGVGSLVACGSDTKSASTPVIGAAAVVAKSEPKVTNPDEAVARLKTGAARFASGSVSRPDQSVPYRLSLATGQHPFAAVLSCSDSRVPPEIVFDQGLGDLFVSRTAGQVVGDAVLGSLQYGVAELKIPLLVVLGHEKCGAVKATVEAVEKKSAPMGNSIDAIVTAIKPAVEQAETDKATDMIDASVHNNVVNIVAALGKNALLGAAVSSGALRIVGARYDLDAGTVAFLT